MTAMTQNDTDFAARLQRIDMQAKAAKQLLFVGLDEVYTVSRRERVVKRSAFERLLIKLVYPSCLVAAVALGAVSHTMGLIARFHLAGMPGAQTNASIETLNQIILGLVIAMALTYGLGFNNRLFTSLKSLGVVAGVLLWHNAVHMYPQEFAVVTSEPWVQQVLADTQAQTLRFLGASLPF